MFIYFILFRIIYSCWFFYVVVVANDTSIMDVGIAEVSLHSPQGGAVCNLCRQPSASDQPTIMQNKTKFFCVFLKHKSFHLHSPP